MPLIPAIRRRGISELEFILVDRASSGTARATQRNPVLEKKLGKLIEIRITGNMEFFVDSSYVKNSKVVGWSLPMFIRAHYSITYQNSFIFL